MEHSERQELMREYAQRLSNLRYWVIHFILGYGRYTIKNKTIVKKSWKSVIYGAFVLVATNLTLVHIVYETTVLVKYLLYTELVILLELSMILNFFVWNITFSNRGGIAKLINCSIDIDMLLGRTETKFMRIIVDNVYTVLGIPVLLVQITIVTFMYFTFDVSIAVHITGSAYFIWMLSIFYDINYLLTHSSFVSLRTRYLNVALMKFLNIEVDYVPDLFLFSGLFWRTKHNDLVTFHKNANTQEFFDAYKMVFQHARILQECYKFIIFTGIMCVTMGSLLSVQTVIIYGRTGIDVLRKSIMVGWLAVSWLFLFFMCLEIDIFSRQIDQTKLICTFAQLTSIADEKVYRFTKSILRAMEIREARISIYGLFYFDPSVMLRMAASVFVYLTAQLQLTIPAVEDTTISISTYIANGTTTTSVAV